MRLFKHILIGVSFATTALLITSFMPVLAQEEIAGLASSELQIDETVTAEDLGIKDPSVLPGSFWYPFKNAWRGLEVAFTFDKAKKAGVRLEHANERVLEAQKLEEKGDKKSLARLDDLMERYQKDMAKAQAGIEELEKVESNSHFEILAEKLVNSEINKRKVLQRLESNESISEKTLERVMAAKEKSVETFGQIMQKIIPKEKIAEKIEQVLGQQKGSEFKDLKQLQILKEIKEGVPAEIKAEFEKVENKRIDNLKEKFRQIKLQEREKIESYLKNASGDEVNQLEVINDLMTKAHISGSLRNVLGQLESEKTDAFQAKLEGIQNEELRERVINKIELKSGIDNPVKERLQNQEEIKKVMVQIQEKKREILRKQEQNQEQINNQEINQEERLMPKKSEKNQIKARLGNEGRDNADKLCKDMCGNGRCEEIVCQAEGCPCPETPQSCPQDCE